MNNKEKISKQIWAYLDNNDLSIGERQVVVDLIVNDEIWVKEYKEILAIHGQLQHLKVQEPSMRFAKNILEKLPTTKRLFVQPKELLSFNERASFVFLFFVGLLIASVPYLPKTIEAFDASGPIHGKVEAAIQKFALLMDFHIESRLTVIIIFVMLIIIFVDHLISKGDPTFSV